MVAVAQLVESRIVIPVVVGSNPISHPSFFFRINGLLGRVCAGEARVDIAVAMCCSLVRRQRFTFLNRRLIAQTARRWSPVTIL